MFGFFRPKPDELYIDRGSVYCPRHGTDVEVDRCLSCAELKTIDERAATPYLRCGPTRSLSDVPSAFHGGKRWT
jgi:hypothetical protein